MINFSDEDIKRISFEYVNYQALRDDELAKLASTNVVKDEFEALDNSNKQFTDFYRQLASKYHTELNYLNEDTRTSLPDENSLIDGARRGTKYYPVTVPSDIWLRLPPKIQPENNANPTSVYSGPNELGSIQAALLQMSGIVNGFSGAGVADVETTYNGGPTIRITDVTTFSVGGRFLIYDNGESLFAEITSITQDAGSCSDPQYTNQATCESNMENWTQPLEGELGINVLSYSGGPISAGAEIVTSLPGFTNDERQETVGMTTERQAFLQVFKSLVDSAINDVRLLYENTIIPHHETYDDIKNKALNEAELVQINTVVQDIIDWQALPSTGLNSRFNDVNLGVLEDAFNLRLTQITERITEIQTILGSVSQDPASGNFSGSGIYFDFADWENKRINTATGTLARFFNIELALVVIQQNIDNLDSNRDEQNAYFFIQAFITAQNIDNQIEVADASDFSIGDMVKISANEQPVLEVEITDIQGNFIEIDTVLPIGYNVTNQARIVKLKS